MLSIITADITTLRVDAIVNAANTALRGGGGVDGAIHRAAGPELLEELQRYAGCPTGNAVITRGYRLPAKYVIHAVGPIWRGGAQDEARLLASAYEHAFARALEVADVKSIAFAAISTGAYGFPKAPAARIALTAMLEHEPRFERVVACLYDAESARLYEQTLAELRPDRVS
jgi:O-acetyl-ADP-ribose deacetylase (regulator of RNase III)